jgi:CubicO group peptidase (beta-lactamase class C family)
MSPDFQQKIDAIMQEFVSPDGPGVAVLVGRDDAVLVRKAYGLANVERRELLTPENRFIMASVTKQFVGMAIMLLKHRGLLEYDDAIARFFPDYPPWKHEITVRHLLNQTSGLQEYLTKSFWQEAGEHGGSIDLDGLLQRIATFTDLESLPGARWRYCNTNYILLGSIVERVSGAPFRAFMEETIFGPLGMKDSFAGDSGDMPERQATGYEFKSKTKFEPRPFNREVVGWADGNVISTLDDMFIWAQSLSTDALLPLDVKAQAFVPWNPLDPTVTRYGFGQMMGERRGVREIHHSGGTLGYNTRLSRFPDEKLTVILLSNAEGIGVERIHGAIAEELLGDKMAPIKPVCLPVDALTEKAGTYTGKPRDHHESLEIAYSADNGTLTGTRRREAEGFESSETAELVPLGRDLFLMDRRSDRYLLFTREGGAVSGVLICCVGSVTSLPFEKGTS